MICSVLIESSKTTEPLTPVPPPAVVANVQVGVATSRTLPAQMAPVEVVIFSQCVLVHLLYRLYLYEYITVLVFLLFTLSGVEYCISFSIPVCNL